ncbi:MULTISPECIES: hypothetical protein [Pseudomonas]|uniref:hypothetical protein n=1 Tax=Pseudomonas TaxID=286 RepID=UPI00218B3427|nr:hypothetical protein [Pseudomonas sp. LRP2-20]BDM22650.1 hypothetical protein KMS_R24070 [Pseudomonas sp. LRP2-20]
MINISHLPRNRTTEPLDLPPPQCPVLGLASESLQQRYAAFIVQAVKTRLPVNEAGLRELGQQLASELLSKATDLGSSMAHELSDEIYWLVQCAAIVSLHADGPQSAAFAGYRKHVDYYRGMGRVGAQVEAFERYVAANGLPADEREIQSRSADDRYRLLVTPWEAGNTHWVYRPQIIDTGQGTCLLAFDDSRWSADSSTWLSAGQVELTLRKYPGNQPRRSLQVVIDCDQRHAQAGSRVEVELVELEGVLDALLNSADPM